MHVWVDYVTIMDFENHILMVYNFRIKLFFDHFFQGKPNPNRVGRREIDTTRIKSLENGNFCEIALPSKTTLKIDKEHFFGIPKFVPEMDACL